MTPEEFIDRWRGNTRSERSAAQQHFLELCEVLGVNKPGTPDFEFEKSTRRIGGAQGYADVWKDGCFIWEYKGAHGNLVKAYAQLKQYADAFGNPPLLIVSDMAEIRIHTNFTNAIAQEHVIALRDLRSRETRDLLRDCFIAPSKLLPTSTRESVTAEAASRFARIAVELRRHYDERRVAHFVNKLVFCLFAEDIELLPDRVFADILEEAQHRHDDFGDMLRDLFRAMANPHGRFGTAAIPWFNGGLFDDDDVLPLGIGAVRDLMSAARLDWKAIDPTIFGTLFEGGLDDKRRAEMASLFDTPEPEPHAQPLPFAAPAANRGVGIHYTDEATIMKIIEPVVMMPLRRDWEQTKAQICDLDERRARANSSSQKEKLLAEARGLYADFRASLGDYRVLDPACGSGNFLALSLRALKDFDLAVLDDAKAMGLPPDEFRVGPEAVMGIEINGYAAELARLTVWITELQWQIRKGLGLTRRPILDRLDGIVRADALLTSDGRDRPWPEADVVIGNPPFVGGKRMRTELGDAYVDKLFAAFAGRVPAEADLVCYWFAKAEERMRARPPQTGSGPSAVMAGLGPAIHENGVDARHKAGHDEPRAAAFNTLPQSKLRRAGLVATNSIRGGANRRVLDRIVGEGTIFNAWSDEPWQVPGGPAVRVSLVCFSQNSASTEVFLNGRLVPQVYADLTAGGADLTKAVSLVENVGICFEGYKKYGPFDVPGAKARAWLALPRNPNGRGNAHVVHPWLNAKDVVRRSSDRWVVDFSGMSIEDATLFEAPFSHVQSNVRPIREKDRNERTRLRWWEFERSRPDLRRALEDLDRYIGTHVVAKHRLFVWVHSQVWASNLLDVVARDDDTAFGILHSRFHEAWSIGLCTWLGVGNDPRYTPSTTFETFPFPDGLTPNIPAADYANDPRAVAIAAAARRLNELREAWLNPPDRRARARGRAGLPRPPLAEKPGGRRGPQKAHADPSLQRASGLAR